METCGEFHPQKLFRQMGGRKFLRAGWRPAGSSTRKSNNPEWEEQAVKETNNNEITNENKPEFTNNPAPGPETALKAEEKLADAGHTAAPNPADAGRAVAALTGTLYLCATPIGNLGDITERVLRTLEEVDLIAAEDTRNTLRLLNHFEIKKPLTSYHEYNKYAKADELISKLLRGQNIALVTDAGTPAISDPGEVIAAKCLEQGIRVTSLPGACALITALTMSGMPARRFCFEGFLPVDKKERRYILTELRREERTTILYEAPHHLRGTLQELYENLGDRKITLCRELTKKFEEAMPTTLEGAIEYYGENEPRGEYVLVLAGADRAELEEEKRKAFDEMTIEEHMALYMDQGLSRKEAMKKVAADRGVSKRDIYKELL